MKRLPLIALTLVAVSAAYAQNPSFKHVLRLNLNSANELDPSKKFTAGSPNGQEVGAIAFDGANAYLAGWKYGTDPSVPVGVMKITNVLDPATRAVSNIFTATGIAQDASDVRLAWGGNSLYFMRGVGILQVDPATPVSAGVVKLDANGTVDMGFSGGFLDASEANAGGSSRRVDGMAYDTFEADRLGMAHFGRGLFIRRNAITGLDGQNGFWSQLSNNAYRAIAFDATGNIYLRRSNDVLYAPRTGSTSTGTQVTLIDNDPAELQQMNIAWLKGGTGFSASIAYNLRNPFDGNNIVRLALEDGSVVANLNGTEPINGVAQDAFENNLLNFAYGEAGGKQYLFVVSAGAMDRLSVYEIQGPTATVAGKLSVGSYDPAALDAKTWTYELRSGSTVVDSGSFTTDDQGNYSIATTARGSLDLFLDSRGFLGRQVTGLSVTDTGLTGIDAEMINGDIDGDNSVTVFDYDILSANFDKTSADSDWTTQDSAGIAPVDADLDADGSVTVFDYDILSANFDAVGDN